MMMSQEDFDLIQEKRYELMDVLARRHTPKEIDELTEKINKIFVESFQGVSMGAMTMAAQAYADKLILRLIKDGREIDKRQNENPTGIIH